MSTIPQIDSTVPHSARVWNYLLGGKDNYPVDRLAADMLCGIFPGMTTVSRNSRQMLTRVVRHLAGEAGVRQFLDIGTGLPTVDNIHEVAQRTAPECRVVYVDNDPLVLAYAQALLASSPEGATDYVGADARDADLIVHMAGKTLDFAQPVALTLMGLLGLIPDYDEARSTVRRLVEALPPGSYLAIYDGTDTDPMYVEAMRRYNTGSGAVPYVPRAPERIAGYFEGLEILEPGIVPVTRWRPDEEPVDEAHELVSLGGVGRTLG
ncbi:SAM-dependent methyltransferase [Spirillospora sp. NPDC047279]|uniref:SAM-dependent methyltransferase n=1 Tax=Spirillospora sp. NPDC047279 TaxID=3155478 RepID=UPI0033FA90A8